jgi:hypothetical protein
VLLSSMTRTLMVPVAASPTPNFLPLLVRAA